jgi:hypothetical protein
MDLHSLSTLRRPDHTHQETGKGVSKRLFLSQKVDTGTPPGRSCLAPRAWARVLDSRRDLAKFYPTYMTSNR